MWRNKLPIWPIWETHRRLPRMSTSNQDRDADRHHVVLMRVGAETPSVPLVAGAEHDQYADLRADAFLVGERAGELR